MAPVKTENAEEQEENLVLSVLLDIGEDTPSYYVNFAEVTHSQNEFQISFARVPTKLSFLQRTEAVEKGYLTITPEMQLLIPPAVIYGLIDALTKQVEKYESRFGKAMTGEGKS